MTCLPPCAARDSQTNTRSPGSRLARVTVERALAGGGGTSAGQPTGASVGCALSGRALGAGAGRVGAGSAFESLLGTSKPLLLPTAGLAGGKADTPAGVSGGDQLEAGSPAFSTWGTVVALSRRAPLAVSRPRSPVQTKPPTSNARTPHLAKKFCIKITVFPAGESLWWKPQRGGRARREACLMPAGKYAPLSGTVTAKRWEARLLPGASRSDYDGQSAWPFDRVGGPIRQAAAGDSPLGVRFFRAPPAPGDHAPGPSRF